MSEKKVYMAMSGGVDSSVAVALLKKRGYHVVGVFFKPWSPLSGGTAQWCNWQQDRLDAMRVAAKLGVEFKTWDFSKEYGQKVAQYMIDGYRAGITPNPDVMCNKEIKFGLFLKKALEEGADFIATGHYARVISEVKPQENFQRFHLLRAKDKNKDQTYFLWTLTQEQLKHCLFPIGAYTKPEVRKLAKKFGLPTFDKKDSQGVCFVGELNMHDFLREYIKPQPGPIYLAVEPLNSKSAVQPLQIGTHDGAAYYTIGQRHGLNIKIGDGPYYVVAKDIKKNIIYVATTSEKLKTQSAKLREVNWVSEKPKFPCNAEVQIRYRGQIIPVQIKSYASRFELYARQPLTAVAAGQSVVFYRGQEILGGGVIAK